MPSHLVRIRPTPSAAAHKAIPDSPAMRCPRVRERSKVSQWWLVSVLAAAVCRSEFTDMPGGHGGWESDSQAACRARSAGGHHRFRQVADRGAGVWSPPGQACASGDGPEQFKVSCGQGPIVMRLTDGGAHDAEPVARVVD